MQFNNCNLYTPISYSNLNEVNLFDESNLREAPELYNFESTIRMQSILRYKLLSIRKDVALEVGDTGTV